MAEHELQQVVDKMGEIRSLALPGNVTFAMLASSVRGICDNIIALAKYIIEREDQQNRLRVESWGAGTASDPEYKEAQRAETERYHRMLDKVGPVHQFIVPPSDGRHVILLMTNGMATYRIVGQYHHINRVYRFIDSQGFMVPLIPGCIVTGWQELP